MLSQGFHIGNGATCIWTSCKPKSRQTLHLWYPITFRLPVTMIPSGQTSNGASPRQHQPAAAPNEQTYDSSITPFAANLLEHGHQGRATGYQAARQTPTVRPPSLLFGEEFIRDSPGDNSVGEEAQFGSPTRSHVPYGRLTPEPTHTRLTRP